MIRIIEGAGNLVFDPCCCAVTRRTQGTFVDFGTEIVAKEFPHLYLESTVVEEAAKALGMVSGYQFERLKESVAENTEAFERRIAELEKVNQLENVNEEAQKLREEIAA